MKTTLNSVRLTCGFWLTCLALWITPNLTAEELPTFWKHTFQLYDTVAPGSLAFSPDGQYLAVHRGEGVHVFRVADGTMAQTIPLPGGGSGPCAFSPDSKYLAAARDYPGVLFMLRTSDWNVVSTNAAHGKWSSAGPSSLAFLADGSKLFMSWSIYGYTSRWIGLHKSAQIIDGVAECHSVTSSGDLINDYSHWVYAGADEVSVSADGKFAIGGWGYTYYYGGPYGTPHKYDAEHLSVGHVIDYAFHGEQYDAAPPYVFVGNDQITFQTDLGLELRRLSDWSVVWRNGYGETFGRHAYITPNGQELVVQQPLSIKFINIQDGTDKAIFDNPIGHREMALSPGGEYLATAGSYEVRVLSNPLLNGFPTILTQPENQDIRLGGRATFSVQATGDGVLKYRWHLHSTNSPGGTNAAIMISGATNATLVITNVNENQEGIYQVEVSNAKGSITSSAAQLAIARYPLIQIQPISATVPSGYNLNLSVAALGEPPLHYQWQLEGVNLNMAAKATLAFYNLQGSNSGNYRVVVTNSYGSVTSQVATLTVTGTPPVFLSEPASQQVAFGSNVVLSCRVSGSLPLHYKWWFNNLVIARETERTLALAEVDLSDAGAYRVEVYNSEGLIISAPAILEVLSPAEMTPPDALWRRSGQVMSTSSLAKSADGQLLVTGSTDGMIKLWRTADTKELLSFEAHPMGVADVAALPDGNTLATLGYKENRVRFWNLTNGMLIRSLILEVTGNVTRVEFSPDASLLAASILRGNGVNPRPGLSIGDEYGRVELRLASDGRLLRSFDETPGKISTMTFSPNGQQIAYGEGVSGDIVVRQVADGALARRLSGHVSSVTALAFSTNGATLASGDESGTICLWKMADGSLLTSYRWHRQPICSFIFGDGLISADISGILYRCNLVDYGKKRLAILGTPIVALTDVPNGRLFLSANGLGIGPDEYPSPYLVKPGSIADTNAQEHAVQGWQADSGAWRQTYTAHGSRVTSLDFGLRGGVLATGGRDGMIKLWATESGRIMREFQAASSVHSVALSANGAWVASASQEGKVQLWPVIQDFPSSDFSVSLLPLYAVAFVSGQDLLATGGEDGTLRLLSPGNGTIEKSTVAHTAPIRSLACMAGGFLLATAGDDKKIKLWNSTNLALTATLAGHTNTVTALVFSPDDSLLASSSEDGTVIVWQMPVGALLRTLPHSQGVKSVSFAPDGKTLASVGRDGAVRLWQVSDGRPLVVYNQATAGVSCAAFSPLVEGLAFGFADGSVLMAKDNYTKIPPVILVQPLDAVGRVGGEAVFQVQAQGPVPLTFQWRRNGVTISKATNNVLSLTNLALTSAAKYTVVVSNPYGTITSSNALLTISGIAPEITRQPRSYTADTMDTVSLSVMADGTEPLNYLWYHGRDLLQGETNSSLRLTGVLPPDAGSYKVVITNLFGKATSDVATLTVTVVAPSFTLQPTNITLWLANDTTLRGTATGSLPLVYQWLFNGAIIPKATNDHYNLFNITPQNEGSYSLVVTNWGGSMTSQVARVIVKSPVVAGSQSFTGYYASPGTNTIFFTFENFEQQSIDYLAWHPTLPDRWTVLRAAGDGSPRVSAGTVLFNVPITNKLLRFSVDLRVLAGQTGSKTISSVFEYNMQGIPIRLNATVTPDPLVLTDTAPQEPFRLLSIRRIQGNAIGATLNGPPNQPFVIEYSANFTNWSAYITNTLDSAGSGLLNLTAPMDVTRRFYRARTP